MLVNSAGLHFQYLRHKDDASKGQCLARFLFDERCVASADKHYLSTGLPLLDGSSAYEVISTTGANLKQGHSERAYWAETDSYLLLAYWADEAEMGGLQAATETLYTRLLTEARARGYPHLVRVWNYFADINDLQQDLERYRQFCIGRFDAFAQQEIGEDQFPSACALGHSGGDLLVYALASKTAVQHFENPQQERAYHYPAEYGPRSPSFARASLVALAGQAPTLFVSGTASVVGFVTQHPDDLDLQIKVTLENIDRLLAHVGAEYSKKQGGAAPSAKAEILKVYVRNPQDLANIKQQMERAYPTTPTVYLSAAICRADLLLEIDGIWHLEC